MPCLQSMKRKVNHLFPKKLLIISTALAAILVLSTVYVFAGCRPAEILDPAVDEEIAEEEPVEEEIDRPAEEIEEPPEVEEPAPEPEPAPIEDAFVYAILEGIDWDAEMLQVTQLEADPHEPDIGASVALADDFQVIRSVAIRSDEEVRDYEKKIDLGQIPLGSEIGIQIQNNQAVLIISQIYVDQDQQVPRVEMQQGEDFIYALLKWADYDQELIGIEQLEQEPYEQEYGPELALAEGYQVQMSVVERHEAGEQEYIVDIALQDIPIGEEIGIIVDQQSKARAIVYGIAVE